MLKLVCDNCLQCTLVVMPFGADALLAGLGGKVGSEVGLKLQVTTVMRALVMSHDAVRGWCPTVRLGGGIMFEAWVVCSVGIGEGWGYRGIDGHWWRSAQVVVGGGLRGCHRLHGGVSRS